MSDARLRRYFLGAACLWAVLNIAGGVWWLAVSWDEYRHLDGRWRSILGDLPDVFAKSVVIALAAAGFILFLGLPERKRLPVYASLAAGGVTGFFSAFVIACMEVGYWIGYVMPHPPGGGGFPSLSSVRWTLFTVMEYTAILISGWKMPWKFAMAVGLITYGIYRVQPFSRVFIRPALFAPVGLAVGVVLLILPMHGFYHLGWYAFSCGSYIFPLWFEFLMAAIVGSLQAFLFSGLTRYLHARMDYWEDRGR